MDMNDIYRTGRNIHTTLYRGEEGQPCAWVPNDPALAARIVSLLNRERAHARADHVAGARYEVLLSVQAQALEAQAKTIAELEQERAALCRALYRESSDNMNMRSDIVGQAESLQQENVRLAEENAVMRAGLPFPVSAVIAENVSLKRALTEKELAFARSTADGG